MQFNHYLKGINMKIGDHLVSPRTAYSHHGLYVGSGNVVHYYVAGSVKSKSDGVIAITSLKEFCQGSSVHIKDHKTRLYSREESVNRACSRLGEGDYNIIIRNCEHLVNWSINGVPISGQVNNVIITAVGYKVLTKTVASKAISSIPFSPTINTAINVKRTAQVARFAMSASGSSLLSSGATTGLTGIASGLSGGAASGLLASAVSIATPLAPLAAAIATVYLVDYGIRKLFD
jgi:hypothetical protein